MSVLSRGQKIALMSKERQYASASHTDLWLSGYFNKTKVTFCCPLVNGVRSL